MVQESIFNWNRQKESYHYNPHSTHADRNPIWNHRHAVK